MNNIEHSLKSIQEAFEKSNMIVLVTPCGDGIHIIVRNHIEGEIYDKHYHTSNPVFDRVKETPLFEGNELPCMMVEAIKDTFKIFVRDGKLKPLEYHEKYQN